MLKWIAVISLVIAICDCNNLVGFEQCVKLVTGNLCKQFHKGRDGCVEMLQIDVFETTVCIKDSPTECRQTNPICLEVLRPLVKTAQATTASEVITN